MILLSNILSVNYQIDGLEIYLWCSKISHTANGLFFHPRLTKQLLFPPKNMIWIKNLIEFPPFHNHAVFPIETILPTEVDLPLLQV